MTEDNPEHRAPVGGPRIGVDVGGTFTDIALETLDGRLETCKVPTTPRAPERGVMNGVALALERAGVGAAEVTGVIHGTTLATNALIERKGAVTALLCTEGFRDTLRLAYENRYDQYDIWLDKPEPLVPRHLTFPVVERMDVRGAALRPLDERCVADVARGLVEEGVEAVAIGFLHAYANPAHERRVRDLLRAELPGLAITLSSDVCPEVREYERLTTAVCNAYVQPMMARYLGALDNDLKAAGIACPMLLMTSSGSVCSLGTAMRHPVRLVESGPSGGAVLAAGIAAARGESRVLSYDMGGTTAKICLVDDATPQTSRTFEIARAARFVKGSGMTVRLPVIEMIEIGAGGGSIAGVDGLGRLAVGPASAGAEPGPSCYGGGGTDATVTDADLVLGRLDADDFAEGRMSLDNAAAADAVARHVAAPMGIGTADGALGILEVVDETMANAAQVHAVERGKHFRGRAMIAFGGAGPLHACRVAEKLGIARVVIPERPGVGSAVGFLRAPVAFEVVRSRYMTLAAYEPAAVAELFARMSEEAVAVVRQGAGDAALVERRSCFMRYLGQGHEIEVALGDGPLDATERDRLRDAYDAEYARQFARSVPGMNIEILSWKLVVSAPAPRNGERVMACPAHDASPQGERLVTGRARGAARVPLFARASLAPGARFRGPCLVTEGQTTTVVPDGFHGHVDGHGHIVLDRKEDPAP